MQSESEALIDECAHGFFILREKDLSLISEEYLHSDGVWRASTENEHGSYTGYFATEEQAQVVLDRFNTSCILSNTLYLQRRKLEMTLSRVDRAAFDLLLHDGLLFTHNRLRLLSNDIYTIKAIMSILELEVESDSVVDKSDEILNELDKGLKLVYNELTSVSNHEDQDTDAEGEGVPGVDENADLRGEATEEVERFESEGGRAEGSDAT